MSNVLVVGSLHLDIVVEGAMLPVIDETSRGRSWKMVCGGKGGNQACWAAKCGAKTAMVSRVGRDDFGRRLIENLGSCGVDVRFIQHAETTGSGMSVAIVQPDGDYGAAIVSGANLEIEVDVAISALQQRPPPRILVLQNEITEAANIAMARWAKSAGAMCVLNAAPARSISSDLAGLVDVLIVNRVEAELMTGQFVGDGKSAVAAAHSLHRFAPHVIVTLGAGGLVVGQQGQASHAIAAMPVDVRSTHGAGDCFVGQLSAALAGGLSLEDAAMRANSTAAAFVSGQI
jgi:ribokinase